MPPGPVRIPRGCWASIGCPTDALRHARGGRLHRGTPNPLASNGLRRILSTSPVLNARTPGTDTPPVPPQAEAPIRSIPLLDFFTPLDPQVAANTERFADSQIRRFASARTSRLRPTDEPGTVPSRPSHPTTSLCGECRPTPCRSRRAVHQPVWSRQNEGPLVLISQLRPKNSLALRVASRCRTLSVQSSTDRHHKTGCLPKG